MDTARTRNLSRDFQRLAEAERQAKSREFIAPRMPGQCVRVRIDSVIVSFFVEPSRYEGWGIFRPVAARRAQQIREASRGERQSYLDMLPQATVIVSARMGDNWYGRTTGEGRFKVIGDAKIGLPTELQLFDHIICRCDGSRVWYDRQSPESVKRGTALREDLAAMRSPWAPISRKVLPVEHQLYGELYRARQKEMAEAAKLNTESYLRQALAHAGGVLAGFREVDNTYVVEYNVDGERHTSRIGKDLTVQAAGICLNGTDQTFDLQSLVGVIREAEQNQATVRTGLNAT
jgi:hypothetical protein